MTDERNLSTADLAGTGTDEIPEAMRREEGTGDSTPLFPGDRVADLQSRWNEIQTDFVDEPRGAVQQADTLVAETMKQLAETFASTREQLEAQWSRGEEASTEDLRVALQRYRSFFNRLLSV